MESTSHNLCLVLWEVLRVLNILSIMGDILSTMEDVQYCGGYPEYRGRHLEYHKACSAPNGEYHDTGGGYR